MPGIARFQAFFEGICKVCELPEREFFAPDVRGETKGGERVCDLLPGERLPVPGEAMREAVCQGLPPLVEGGPDHVESTAGRGRKQEGGTVRFVSGTE